MIFWDEKTKTKQQTNMRMQLEEMNQKILTKEDRIKRYCGGSSKTNKTGYSKTTKENYSDKQD